MTLQEERLYFLKYVITDSSKVKSPFDDKGSELAINNRFYFILYLSPETGGQYKIYIDLWEDEYTSRRQERRHLINRHWLEVPFDDWMEWFVTSERTFLLEPLVGGSISIFNGFPWNFDWDWNNSLSFNINHPAARNNGVRIEDTANKCNIKVWPGSESKAQVVLRGHEILAHYLSKG